MNPEQRLTLVDALDAYTRGSAAVNGLGHVTGSLRPGMAADLIVLNKAVKVLEDLTTPMSSTPLSRAEQCTPPMLTGQRNQQLSKDLSFGLFRCPRTISSHSSRAKSLASPKLSLETVYAQPLIQQEVRPNIDEITVWVDDLAEPGTVRLQIDQYRGPAGGHDPSSLRFGD